MQSAANTIAVNLWYKGPRAHSLEGPSSSDAGAAGVTGDARLYYLRCLVQSLLADTKTQLLRTARENPTITLTADAFAALPEHEQQRWLQSADYAAMQALLPGVAKQHPLLWRDCLLRIDPLTAQLLTAEWEAAESAGQDLSTFYASIGLGDEERQVGKVHCRPI